MAIDEELGLRLVESVFVGDGYGFVVTLPAGRRAVHHQPEMRQHTSGYVSVRIRQRYVGIGEDIVRIRQDTSGYVRIRQVGEDT